MYFLGIDLGTSSVKVLAIDSNHQIVGDTSREYPVYYPREKWAEQDPEVWWEQTIGAVRDLIAKYQISGNEVAAIGFSGQMHGLVALDEDDEVLFPAILWCDQRTERECEEITGVLGTDRLRELTGNKALTGFTAPKILWVKKNDPQTYPKIRHVLLPKGYIRFRLTGGFVTDVSDASGTLLFDVKNRRWSKEMGDFLELDESVLPDVCESYEVTGKVTDEAKVLLGLSGDVLVVGGAGDQAAGAVGTGTVRQGVASVSLGTSGVVFAAHDDFVVDPACRLHAFCHANGRYHSMGVMLSAASCLKWWTEQIQDPIDIVSLLNEAENAGNSGNVIFLPYLLGERTPYPDPNAKGCFLGVDMNTNRGNLTYAVLEGVAFGLRDSFEILRDMNIQSKGIRVTGGGSKSELWKQILSDILNCEIQEISVQEGGALGAAILAAVGTGRYQSVGEGCQYLIKVVNTIQPRVERKAYYDQLYVKYKFAYHSLKDWFGGKE